MKSTTGYSLRGWRIINYKRKTTDNETGESDSRWAGWM